MALSLLFLVSLTLPLSWSYRDGARSESCYNMLVMHTNFLGVTVPPMECASSCPYQLRMVGRVVGENNLTVEEEGSTTYQCGEVYKLQLATTITATFEGFMIEARENTSSFEEGSTIWGTWVTDPNNRYHAVECNRNSSSSEGPFENAATQSSPDDLSSLNLYWRAPPPPNTADELQQLPGEIKFWFVTVQQRLTYISPVEGPALVRDCSQPLGPTSPTPTMSPDLLMPTDFLPGPTSPTPTMSPGPTSPTPTMSPDLLMPTDFLPSPGLPFLIPTDLPSTTSTRTTTFPSATPILLPFTTPTLLPSSTSTPLPPTTQPLELIPIIVGAVGGAIALLLLITLIIVCCICCKRESDYYDKPLEGTRGRFRSTRKKKFEPTSFAIENKAYVPQVLGFSKDQSGNGTTAEVATTENVAYTTVDDTIPATQNVAYGDVGYVVEETHAL